MSRDFPFSGLATTSVAWPRHTSNEPQAVAKRLMSTIKWVGGLPPPGDKARERAFAPLFPGRKIHLYGEF